MREIGEILVIPKEYDIEWKIDDFLSLPSIYDFSACFDFEGVSWNFGIHPKGSSFIQTEGFIDLYIYKRTEEGPAVNVEFSFSLKNLHGYKVFERRHRGVFVGFVSYPVIKFLPRNYFEERLSEFLVDGALTIVCTLRRLKSLGNETKCSYCEENVGINEISFHERKCRIICPYCNNLVIYSKWYEHECQAAARAEGECSASSS